MDFEFKPFAKIARFNRDIVITEKIDGTNGQIIVNDDASDLRAASRNGFILPGKKTDNFGFAGWVQDNREELLKLGPGRHFGEWWGSGIQRGYGVPKGVRMFSLFNVNKWADNVAERDPTLTSRPACCGVVPTLYAGPNTPGVVDKYIDILRVKGSFAAPGFMNPEGVIVFHTAGGALFKVTCRDDEKPKGLAEAA